MSDSRSWSLHALRRLRETIARMRTAAPKADPTAFGRALRSARPGRSAATLVLLMVGFTVDDLSVLRFPGYLAAAGLGLLILVVGPSWKAHQWTRRADQIRAHRKDRFEALQERMEAPSRLDTLDRVLFRGGLKRHRRAKMIRFQDQSFHAAMDARRRQGRLKLLGATVVLVGWLAFFSKGVPAWAL